MRGGSDRFRQVTWLLEAEARKAIVQPEFLNQPLSYQAGLLLLLGLAVACVSWTITHEEIFREPREFCKEKSQNCLPLYQRKFFYLFTCEYLLQPLCSGLVPTSDALSDAVSRMAWLCNFGVCVGVDRKCLHGRVQSTTTGNQG
jgi:hypothetical protein